MAACLSCPGCQALVTRVSLTHWLPACPGLGVSVSSSRPSGGDIWAISGADICLPDSAAFLSADQNALHSGSLASYGYLFPRWRVFACLARIAHRYFSISSVLTLQLLLAYTCALRACLLDGFVLNTSCKTLQRNPCVRTARVGVRVGLVPPRLAEMRTVKH